VKMETEEMKYFGFSVIHRKFPSAVNLLCLLFLLPVSAFAQTGDNYDVSWNTIDGGGGESSSGKYTMVSTFGQPDAGIIIGGKYTFEGGFLFGEDIPFVADFVVKNKTRINRTVFRYECWVNLTNLSSLAVENVKLELIDTPNNITIIEPCVNYGHIESGELVQSQNTCIIDVNRIESINSAKIAWYLTYNVVQSDQILRQMFFSTVTFEPQDVGKADITGDGKVDYQDLIIMANQWLGFHGSPSADIAPAPSGDGIVNFLDFAVLAENWLQTDQP
jgi:hypothetical protein